MSRPLELVSLVVPVYNEEQVLPLLLARLRQMLVDLPCAAEVLLVNDGSRDRSAALLLEAAAEDERFKVIDFSRNFGHQIAITAGVDFARGDVVVVLDADLQDPPELIGEMIVQYQAGYDVVYAQRRERRGETWFKLATAAGFYWFMKTAIHKEMPPNTGDFRLMSRAVVDALRHLREQHRFMRGMVTWLGFRQTAVVFDRPARAAGETKYPFRKLLALAWSGISSFSALPLRIPVAVGLLMTVGALGFTLAAAGLTLAGVNVPWWSWLVDFQLTLSGLTLLAVGVTGDYVARIYEELKQRPLYIVEGLYNVSLGENATLPQRIAVPHGSATAGRSPLTVYRPAA